MFVRISLPQASQKNCTSATRSLFWRIFMGKIYFPVLEVFSFVIRYSMYSFMLRFASFDFFLISS